MDDTLQKTLQKLNIKLIKSSRSSLSLEVTPNAEVIVRAPYNISDSAIQTFIQKKWFWINTHILIAKKNMATSNDSIDKEKLTLYELKKLYKEAFIKFKNRVEYYAPIIGVSYNKISIKSQTSRWGSCSSQKNLNFNCLLMFAPPETLDYVVIHELCHLKEMNHSNKFWLLVKQIMPDYKQHKQWLKDNGNNLIAKLAKT